MKHQEAGLTLVKLVDQTGEPSLANFLRGNHRLVDERQLAAIAGHQAFGFEPVQERGDGCIRPRVPGRTQSVHRLADGGLTEVPKNLQNVKLGIGNRGGRLAIGCRLDN